MASITVRKLDEGLKRRLRIRAAENGKSMEQEARDILKAALDEEPPTGRNLASASANTDGVNAEAPSGREFINAIRARFEPFGGVELELPPRDPIRPPPEFD